MIYFFYLLSFIFVLILSEITAKKEKKERITYNKKSKENFSDFTPYVARNGRRTPQSLSQISRKLKQRTINPFDKCGDIFKKKSDFNWPSYFENANKKRTTLALNQVFF